MLTEPPCHVGPRRDADTGLTDGQHALQRGAEGPAPKGRTARSTKTGSMGDGPHKFGGCLPRARRAGRAVSGLTNSTQMRALCDTRWSEAASVCAELAGAYGRKLARREGIGIPPTSESAVLEISVSSLTEQEIPLHCRAGARDACQRLRRIG